MAVLRDLRNKQTYTETITIPSDANALLAGPVTISTLVVNGNLNVEESLATGDTLTVTTGNLTIEGNLRIK